jgi:hypothetical protein
MGPKKSDSTGKISKLSLVAAGLNLLGGGTTGEQGH